MVNMRLQRMRRNTTAISSTPMFPIKMNTNSDTTVAILPTTVTTTSSPRITVSAPRSSGTMPTVKWSDSYGGNGEHHWEYNHANPAYKSNDYAAPAYAAPAYPAPAQDYAAPGYSAPYPTYEEAPAAKV
ncbi:Uncharacterized protein APZ42_019718 [Daphnia magna]|uniref:Uncharacterized protein n=1 Tax=Daphnia magna TaxID=35525 RepID=A0A164XNA9_9CRUS|nr:Uncharacterized protein APZ42_019718 [Daphnia magna]